MTLAEKIVVCRRQQGLSQEMLAAQLNVSRQAVSKWETGDAEPESGKLVALAKIFGVTVDWLLSIDSGPVEEMSALPGQISREASAAKPQMERKVVFNLRPAYCIYLVWLVSAAFFAMTASVCFQPFDWRIDLKKLISFFDPVLLLFMLTGGIFLLYSSGLLRAMVQAFRFMLVRRVHESCSEEQRVQCRHAVHAALIGWILGGLLDITAVIIHFFHDMCLTGSAIESIGVTASVVILFQVYTVIGLLVLLPVSFSLKQKQE